MTEKAILITTSNLTFRVSPGYKKLQLVVDDRVYDIVDGPRGREYVEPAVVHGNGQGHEQQLAQVKKEDQEEQPGQAERPGHEQRLFKFNFNSNTVHRQMCKAALAHKRTLNTMFQVSSLSVGDSACKFCFPK